MTSFVNVVALNILAYYIFAVLGVYFFKNIHDGIAITPDYNFDNFYSSFKMIIKFSTGDSWP